jgi:alpha-galactosidase
VDQDPLGCQAARIAQVDRAEVWARPLADGTLAVGLFNRGSRPIRVTATWEQLGLKNAQPVRDLWQRQELGRFERKFSAEVAVHGAVLVKIGTPRA